MFRFVIPALTVLTTCLIVPASAQDWPDRAVRIIVPFGAGGTSDILARTVADKLSVAFKQQFVVENRTGAAGQIGVQAIASAPPDGYTLGVTNVSTLSLIPVINARTSYHPMDDFTHIAYLAGAPVVLATYPGLGVKSLPEFLDFAKKNGKPLTFASSGVGSDGHLVGEAIAAALGLKFEHIPYRATGQALTDAVGGHVNFTTFTLSSTAAFIREGTLTGIAVTSPERMPDYPNLPTFKESGYPALVSSTWFSLSGPAKLRPAITERLNREVQAALASPDVQQKLRRDGLISQPMSSAEFSKFVEQEGARWKPLIESAGLVGKSE
ncbi:MAG TPA: tripartite tricarboxylate transporter substrate binding protein [Xanthobacteraceae bacterium]|jgi:tripartite-type tricarboxylate transporter receptor subunit TctC